MCQGSRPGGRREPIRLRSGERRADHRCFGAGRTDAHHRNSGLPHPAARRGGPSWGRAGSGRPEAVLPAEGVGQVPSSGMWTMSPAAVTLEKPWVNALLRDSFSPFLNHHRACLFSVEVVAPAGRRRRKHPPRTRSPPPTTSSSRCPMPTTSSDRASSLDAGKGVPARPQGSGSASSPTP